MPADKIARATRHFVPPILFVFVFFEASVAWGDGLLYSFSGRISRLFYDGGGVLAAHNVAVGDPVSATYLVDFGAPGRFLLNDGTVKVPADPPLGNVHTTYFHTRLVSATLLPEINGGLNDGPQEVAEYFIGWNQSSPLGNEGLLWGGFGDSYFTVRKSGIATGNEVQEWQPGTDVRGVMVAYSDQDWSIAWADMRLDSITPVPEPGTIFLLGFGGLALILSSRQRPTGISPAVHLVG